MTDLQLSDLQNYGENIEYSTNGSTGQREKAPAEPVCLITLRQREMEE